MERYRTTPFVQYLEHVVNGDISYGTTNVAGLGYFLMLKLVVKKETEIGQPVTEPQELIAAHYFCVPDFASCGDFGYDELWSR